MSCRVRLVNHTRPASKAAADAANQVAIQTRENSTPIFRKKNIAMVTDIASTQPRMMRGNWRGAESKAGRR